jgi:hypothetical protein
MITAMLMIGDGIVAILEPRRDLEVWDGGPKSYREMLRWMAKHPTLTRAVGAAEAAGGILLALQSRVE